MKRGMDETGAWWRDAEMRHRQATAGGIGGEPRRGPEVAVRDGILLLPAHCYPTTFSAPSPAVKKTNHSNKTTEGTRSRCAAMRAASQLRASPATMLI